MLENWIFAIAASASLIGAGAYATPTGVPWIYHAETRATGTKTRLACTRSREIVVQGFPYHNTKALLCVLATFNPGDVKPDILVTIGLEGDGQLDQEDFRFKFDDDKAYDHSVEDLNSTKLLAPTWPKTFAKKMLRAKTLVIEMSVFDNGLQDVTFDVEGLKLPDFGPSEYEQSQTDDASSR